ncbi:MAG: DUF1304 domain-containing protein [Saprospiraceae bacterium]|nr:DUF1304 domain-containing protein [Saprospiraceae bacterium]
MALAIKLLIGFVALEHLFFLYLEMFSWSKMGRQLFKGYDKEFFTQTKVLAANQGLYNGFLAAGLIWTFFIEDNAWQQNVAIFFLGCIAVAGIYGAATADRKIFFVQALPAIIGLILLVTV